MLKLMFGLLLRLFGICLGLFAGVVFFIWFTIFREGTGDLFVPLGLVLIFWFVIIFIQFLIFAGIRLVVSKIFKLNLRHGTVRYFVIAFLYSAGYGAVIDFIPNRIGDNAPVVLVVFLVFPILVFSVIVSAEVLLLKLRNRKTTI